tara:strand:- start:1805 stop:3460 length:1656 start_codon:yes stop_codon:yes gene_type:complete
MTVDPQDIAKRLREAREQTKTESTALTEQLALIDVVIDEYDEVINKIDNKIQPLLPPINQKITAVQQAYLARISHGCRSDLVWSQVDSGTMNIYGNNNQEVKIYQVIKDPSTFRFLGYYGAKFYKFPKNRDYGSNVVEIINTADANLGSTALIIKDENAAELVGLTTFINTSGETVTVAGANAGIQTGDFITDDLDTPSIFLAGAGTSVTGVGITQYAAYNYPVSGFCTTSDNKIYADQKIGIITNFNIGDEVYGDEFKSGAGIVATGTTITGFGTAVGIVSFINDAGITTGAEVVLDFISLSNAVISSIASTIGHTFHVGMVSSYYFANLSAEPSAPGINSSFIVIRQDAADIVFDSSKNPIDPVEIGIAQGNNIGRGHKLELINNGDPNIIANWHEVRNDPEPLVGAGRVEYYVGTTQWPTISRRDADGDVTTTHATLGQRIIVGVGATVGAGVGYTGNPPGGNIPSDCGTYDSAIATAEDEMNSIIQQNTPIINHYINGADSMRQVRDEDETTAWGLMQGLGFNSNKASRQLGQAELIEDFDWEDILG